MSQSKRSSATFQASIRAGSARYGQPPDPEANAPTSFTDQEVEPNNRHAKQDGQLAATKISKKMMSATEAATAERTEVAAVLAHAGGYYTLSKAAIHGAEQDTISLDGISNADAY